MKGIYFFIGTIGLVATVHAQSPSDAEKCIAAVGNAELTASACTRAIDSNKHSGADLSALLASRGLSWREQGYDDVAIGDFDEAIRVDPKNATAYVSRGNLSGDKGDHDKALSDYNVALALNPKHAQAYSNRGVSWMARGDFDRALADVNRAIQLDPKMPDAWNNRAFVWKAKGDTRRAIADFDQVIKLEPRFIDAYDSLALIYATSADPKVRNGKLAVDLAWKACELVQWRHPYYLNTLAAAQAEAGDFKAAVETQSRALAMRVFSEAGQRLAVERLQLYQAGKPFHESPSRRDSSVTK